MNEIILQVALSLDGYIARKDGSVDFLEEPNQEFQSTFLDFLKRIDTIIMGRKTYEMMLKFGEIPFKDKTIFVLTNSKLPKLYNHVIFSHEDIKKLINTIDGNIWLFGGADVIKQFLDKNLVDELQLFIVPKIIGEGIPLFSSKKEINGYRLVKHEKYGNSLYFVYRK